MSTSPEAVPEPGPADPPRHAGRAARRVSWSRRRCRSGAESVHNTNEDRLLNQRVREAAAVVTAAIPTLADSARLGRRAGRGRPRRRGLVRQLMTPVAHRRCRSSRRRCGRSRRRSRHSLPPSAKKPELATATPATISRVLRARASASGTVTIRQLADRTRHAGSVTPTPCRGRRDRTSSTPSRRFRRTAAPTHRQELRVRRPRLRVVPRHSSRRHPQLVASSTGGAVPRDRNVVGDRAVRQLRICCS